MAKKSRMIPMSRAVKAIRVAVAATKKAEEAMARAHLKVFAAKMIAQIAKAADLPMPPASVKRAAVARARQKVAAARKAAEAARKRARVMAQQAARA